MSRKKYRAIAPDGRPYALLSEVKEGDTLLESSLREYKVCKNSSGNLGFWWLDDFYRLVFIYHLIMIKQFLFISGL